MHFCHTSVQKAIKLAQSSVTYVSGRLTDKCSRKPSSCDWSALHVRRFSFFSLKMIVKTSITTFDENKLVQQVKLQWPCSDLVPGHAVVQAPV